MGSEYYQVIPQYFKYFNDVSKRAFPVLLLESFRGEDAFFWLFFLGDIQIAFLPAKILCTRGSNPE